VPVKEVFQGETVWEGIVEVFDLHGHPKANRAYAWAHDTDEPGRKRNVAVLQIQPVTSPIMRLKRRSERSLGNLVQQKQSRRVGRPKLPKGAAKGRIVPVRFTADDLKAMAAAAKAKDQSVSEWIRSTIHAELNP
jgi:predicted HicB family RNase H-like nuclease